MFAEQLFTRPYRAGESTLQGFGIWFLICDNDAIMWEIQPIDYQLLFVFWDNKKNPQQCDMAVIGTIRKCFAIVICFGLCTPAQSRTITAFADSVRNVYHIPELAFAVISSDSVYEMHVLGYKRALSEIPAEPNDKFRIGSNTKAITGFLAAQLVKEEKISWDTKFFDLFPEMKAESNPAYYDLSLLNLLTFRTRLFRYTYTNKEPTKKQFTGTEEEQRYQFTQWFLQHKPVPGKDSINFSNLGYVAAGLMLEKASGKPYKQMVQELGAQLHIDFNFGQPNNIDTAQPWGHDKDLTPEPPGDNYKLSWLLPAGNINVSLPDYAKFIQLQLQGLQGKSELLSAEEFDFLHFGLAKFAVGWFWETDEANQVYSYNEGNPGTFLTQVYVYKDLDRAYILFANVQSDEAETGMGVIYDELKKRYEHQ